MATNILLVASLILLSVSIIKSQNCGHCSVVGRFCYAFNGNVITNAAAVTQCSNAGGRLPFFSSAQDVTDFATYATSVSMGASWLGYWNPNGHSAANPGNWVDQQGNIGTYTNWAGGQPDDWGGEHCTQTYPGGQWNDIPCGNSFQVVCQCACPMPSGPYMTVTGGVPPAINSVISLTCATCYQINGFSSATCVYNGATVVWNVNIAASYCARTQCSALFTGSTGTYPATPYLSCTSYTYNCITNYIVDPRNVVGETYACSATGTWDKTFIPCIITCPVLANSGKVFVTGGTSANLLNRPVVGTVATFQCAAGWTLQGPTNSTCQSSGTWSNGLPYCNRTGSLCDDIFDTTTGMISGIGTYTLGTQYNFTCSPNMLVWPANAIVTTYTCQMDTMWDETFTPCTQTCPPVTSMPNGIVSQDTIPNVLGRPIVGSTVEFFCNSGYLQVGSTNSTCQSDGTWSDPMPTCSRLTCPNVFTIASNTGTITSTILLSNTIYTFTCNSLYFLPKPNKIAQNYICQANATWNLPFQPCVPVCPAITTLSNGKATGGGQNTAATGGVASGTQVAFSCNLGFSLVGAKSSICNPDGQWSDPIPYCSDTQCPWIFDKSGEIDANVFLPTNTYYFTCAQNSFIKGSLESGMEYYCDTTGNWQPQFTSCSPVCPALVGFSHGQVAYQYSFGSQLNFAGSLATFSCDVGYRLNGSAQLSCGQSGNWSDQMPMCTVALCNDIWTGTEGIWTPQPPFYSLQSATYECPANSLADNQANLNLQCDITGRWNRPLANCLKTCKVPDFDIDNGRIRFPILNRVIFGDRVMQNATIIVSCNEGFSVSQPSMIVCSSNGIWTAPMPHCIRDSNNPWWWPFIFTLILLFTVLFGICLICCVKISKRKYPNPTYYTLKIDTTYYG